MSWEIKVCLTLCLGRERALETGIFYHRLEETDARRQMCCALVIKGLGYREKSLTLMQVLHRSLEKEREQEQELSFSSLPFCRQRERKNKAAADWDSWVKKLKGKNSSRLSNNLLVLGMSEKTASNCVGNQARDAAEGRGGSCQRDISLRAVWCSKEEQAWSCFSAPRYNSVETASSLTL